MTYAYKGLRLKGRFKLTAEGKAPDCYSYPLPTSECALMHGQVCPNEELSNEGPTAVLVTVSDVTIFLSFL